MIHEEIRATWRAVAHRTDEISSITAKALPEHPSLLIGVEPKGAIHLLIPSSEVVPVKTYGALSIKPRMLRDSEGEVRQYIDLACSEQGLREAFLWLASEIVARTEGVGVSPQRVINALEDFKALFTDHVTMTRGSLIGLLGELEVLERLTAYHAGWQVLDWWVRDAQDFSSEYQCLEVKATEASSGGSVSVHGIEQFASDLPTYLVVLAVREAEDNTVAARVERLVAAGVPRSKLAGKIAEVFEPDSHLAGLGFDAEPIGWWRVNSEFPFLLPEDIPERKRLAINSLTYTVPVAAFPADFLMDEKGVADGFLA